MKIIRSAKEIRALSTEWKKSGQRVSLVPTMGCLHEGHLSLMRKAKSLTDKTIVSLFINPKQFGPHEDLASYPEQFQTDCSLIIAEGVDALFCPAPEEMYSAAFQTNISVTLLSQGMCGKDRPVHFDGVATVVTKLFNIINPDVAIFGEKDFQQLVVVRQLTEDLDYNIEIIGSPIVREADGLAMSSRNRYLDEDGRQCALCLSQAIMACKDLAKAEDNVSAEIIIGKTEEIVKQAGGRLEYAVVVNEFTLVPDKCIDKHSVLALAVKIGDTIRLIDNSKLLMDS